MTLLEIRLEYERIKGTWRSRPPAEHRFDIGRLQELLREANESPDEGTEQLSVEIDDLIGQIGHTSGSGNPGHPPHSGGFIERATRCDTVRGGSDAPVVGRFRAGHRAVPRPPDVRTEPLGRHGPRLLLGRGRPGNALRSAPLPPAGELDLGVLRSWLAKLTTVGTARSSVARKAAAARAFTSWAHRTGLISTDPGARLTSPKVAP